MGSYAPSSYTVSDIDLKTDLKTTDAVQQKNKLKICFNQIYNNFIEKELSSNPWLSNKTINLAQVLLHKKFLFTNGFEDTIFGNLRQFSVQKNNFIQIIHDHNHWVTIYSDSVAEKSFLYLCNSL